MQVGCHNVVPGCELAWFKLGDVAELGVHGAEAGRGWERRQVNRTATKRAESGGSNRDEERGTVQGCIMLRGCGQGWGQWSMLEVQAQGGRHVVQHQVA